MVYHIVNAKIEMHQYVIFSRLGKCDSADIKCFTVGSTFQLADLYGRAIGPNRFDFSLFGPIALL